MSSSPFGTIEEAPDSLHRVRVRAALCAKRAGAALGGVMDDRVLGLALVNVPAQVSSSFLFTYGGNC